jgi:hypothetical protein
MSEEALQTVEFWKKSHPFQLCLGGPFGLKGPVSIALCSGEYPGGVRAKGFVNDATYKFDRDIGLNYSQFMDWVDLKIRQNVVSWRFSDTHPDILVRAAFEMGYIEDAMRCKKVLDELRLPRQAA